MTGAEKAVSAERLAFVINTGLNVPWIGNRIGLKTVFIALKI